MLELIRESYESKRQPETLKEASGYLSRLTEGSYTRIWTRLVGEELLVDNRNDETIPVDKLSRGTREAVYCQPPYGSGWSLRPPWRLIPMVLDDVLVNFDGQRAHAAADLLCDFSRNGHQILMFTCHDHMRDLFYSLGADVKVLPHHGTSSIPTRCPVCIEVNRSKCIHRRKCKFRFRWRPKSHRRCLMTKSIPTWSTSCRPLSTTNDWRSD